MSCALQIGHVQDLAPLSIDTSLNIASPYEIARPASSTSATATILLVEDNDDLRFLLHTLLLENGYAVIACSDGQQALDLFESGLHFSLLLSDMRMPRLSGDALATAVTLGLPTKPIVLMSGTEVSEHARSMIASHGWTFLTKPFRFPLLLEVLRSHIAK